MVRYTSATSHAALFVYVSHIFQDDTIQLVVLLERLLERDALATATLTQLDHCYNFASKNAEVCAAI